MSEWNWFSSIPFKNLGQQLQVGGVVERSVKFFSFPQSLVL